MNNVCRILLWRGLLAGATTFSLGGQTLAEAQAAERANNLPKAEAIYASLVAKHPSAELYERLGLVRHLENKFAEANDAFQKALRLNPQLWAAYLFAGIDLYRMNHFEAALAQLESASKLNSGQNEINYWMGATLIALHREFEGFAMLERVLRDDPGNVDALSMLAQSYADYGTRMLNNVAEKYPDSLPGLVVQAEALEFEGSRGTALEIYRKASAMDPANKEIAAAIARLSQRN